MSLKNTRSAYGWVAIALHWISAVGVTTLYLLGDRMEEAVGRAAKMEARNLHVGVAVLLFTFLPARLFWSASQPAPESLEKSRPLQIFAKALQGLFMLMILVLLVTGPLAIWSGARPIQVFDLFSIPSPFPTRVQWLHLAAEKIHGASSKLFWPLIVLHAGGALKHAIIDRDRTLQRMLWVRR